MKCPSCNKEMEWVKGIAIDTGDWDDRAIGHAPVYNNKTLKLCECLKCLLCGHSEDDKE